MSRLAKNSFAGITAVALMCVVTSVWAGQKKDIVGHGRIRWLVQNTCGSSTSSRFGGCTQG